MFFIVDYNYESNRERDIKELKKYNVIVLGVIESKEFKERDQGTYNVKVLKSNVASVYVHQGMLGLLRMDNKASLTSQVL
ncbi:MAG: hypothetical protein IPG89_20570 [Bacteroidetes bacterium]|nr:hypothetical protein [Bacteroidota bacterium]